MYPFQFAYKEKVRIEDAVLCFLHLAHSHLDKAEGQYTRDCGQQHRSTTGDCTFPFSLYTVHLRLYLDSETCHMQKISDDAAIVACVRGGQKVEYRNLVEDFVAWCHRNNLLLNTSKTKK
ncbi:hypothetical protein NFI96_017236 [Prochilodus magdalenae]|nr:hypothetical protein NFI96_017236 [Prochilodus magdalenae]